MKTFSILLALGASLAPALAQSTSSSSSTTLNTSTASTSSTSASSSPQGVSSSSGTTSIASTSSSSGAQGSTSPSSSSSAQTTQSTSSLASSSSTSSSSTTTTTSTTSAAPVTVQTAGLFTYIGCYSDSTSARGINGSSYGGLSTLTVESCASTCSAYAYFGVEYAQVSLFSVHVASLISKTGPLTRDGCPE